MRKTSLLLLSLFVIWSVSAGAAVKTEQKTLTSFGGLLGKMSGMFGGKSAKEGLTETVAVKGNRKISRTNDTGQIIDLDEEKVYEVNFKGKSYRVITFEELRKEMREAQEKMTKEMAKMEDAPSPTRPEGASEMEITYDLKDSGQKKSISGYDCREMVMTITVHEKGKKLEDSGGMVLTSNMWITPRIDAMKEIQDFEMRYIQKLMTAVDLQQMQQMMGAIAVNPFFKDAMEKFAQESAKLDGTTMLTVAKYETVMSKEQVAQQAQAKQEQEEEDSQIPTSIGGLFGGLAKKAVKKKAEDNNESSAPSTPGRSTFMTMTTELLKITPDVADADLAIPANFKQKK